MLRGKNKRTMVSTAQTGGGITGTIKQKSQINERTRRAGLVQGYKKKGKIKGKEGRRRKELRIELELHWHFHYVFFVATGEERAASSYMLHHQTRLLRVPTPWIK